MTEGDTWQELNFRCDSRDCIIVERAGGDIIIWDSKNPSGPRLLFSPKEYADFRRRVRGDAWPRATLKLVTSALRRASLGRLLPPH